MLRTDRLRVVVLRYRSGKLRHAWHSPMKLCTGLVIAPLLLAACFVFCGCRPQDRRDVLVTSVANPSHTYRATILLRQGFVDGNVGTSPTTYVLLDEDSGKPDYPNGVEFRDSQVVMKPDRCGALELRWTEDHALSVICRNCGLALSAVGPHAGAIGPIRIEYEGFPERSSWEPGAASN